MWRWWHRSSSDDISEDRLLGIIQTKISELPTDARTLLQTRRNVAIQIVAGGDSYLNYSTAEYWLAESTEIADLIIFHYVIFIA